MSSAPVVFDTSAAPDTEKQNFASSMVLSAILTFLAPASWQSSMTACNTSGFVVAAILAGLAQEIFGLMTTTSPFETNCPIPPAASKTFWVKSFTEKLSVWPTPSIINFWSATVALAAGNSNNGHRAAPASVIHPDHFKSLRIDSLRVIGWSNFIQSSPFPNSFNPDSDDWLYGRTPLNSHFLPRKQMPGNGPSSVFSFNSVYNNISCSQPECSIFICSIRLVPRP